MANINGTDADQLAGAQAAATQAYADAQATRTRAGARRSLRPTRTRWSPMA